MPATRISWLDFCRVYTAFMVVLRHVDRWFVGSPSVNYVVDLFNYRSLIFFFFLASGYFSHRPQPGQWLDFRRARTLVVPYVFWCLLGFAVVYTPAIAAGQWGWLSLPKLTAELGLTSWCYWEFSNVPLWFLRTLIILAFFAPLLHRLPNKVLLVLALLCFAWSDVLCNVDAETCKSHGLPRHAQEWLPFRLYESVLAAGFFAGGILLRRVADAERLTRWVNAYAWLPVAGALLLLPAVLGWSFYPPVQSSALVLVGVLSTLSIGALSLRYLPRFGRAVAALAPASFFIYVTHYPILLSLRYALTGSWHGSFSPELCYVMPFFITALSVGSFYLLRRLFPRFMRIVALAR